MPLCSALVRPILNTVFSSVLCVLKKESGKEIEMIRGLEIKTCENRLKVLGMFSLEKNIKYLNDGKIRSCSLLFRNVGHGIAGLNYRKTDSN